MKRLVSLLLAIVLCFGVLAGVCFAEDHPKPDECDPNGASILVTHAGDTTAKYYFDTLNTALIEWACQKLSGDTTITLLKNYEVDKTNGQVRIYIPSIKGDWYNSKPDAKKLIIDLGGNTLSYNGDQHLFRLTRYGITVKNGTIEYSSIRAIFSIGNSTEPTATSAGTTLYKPVVNLENVNIFHNGTGAASSIVTNNIYGTTVNVKDSVLWTAKKTAIELSKTDQSNLDWYKPHTGNAKLTVNIEGSTVGSGGTYPIVVGDKIDLSVDSVAINVKDSTLITNAKKGVIAEKAAGTLNNNGQEPAVQEDYNKSLRGGTLTGTAYAYGTTVKKLPFTDVDANAWYYTFVSDLYTARIISGMTATTFAPEGTLTYGQALKLVTLAVGAPEQAATDAHWASGYLNYALGQGWLYNEVGLDAKITRLQFCQIAAAAASISDQPASNPFKDTDDGAVLALYNAGIINGMSEDSFSPDSSLTRAQISKIICGIIK